MRKRFSSAVPIEHAEPQVPLTYPAYPQLDKLKPIGPIRSEKDEDETHDERLLRYSRDVRTRLVSHHFQRDEVVESDIIPLCMRGDYKSYSNLDMDSMDQNISRWDQLILFSDPQYVPSEVLGTKEATEQLIRKMLHIKQMKKLDLLLNEEEVDDTHFGMIFEHERNDDENVDRDDAKEFADAMRCEDDEELEDDEREYGNHGQDDEGGVV